jgi:ABC-type bacteriocin/lantibiotic exporter with double-glycine peptidase domain
MAMMKGDRARNFRGTMSKLLRYMAAYRLTLVVVLAFAIGSTVFNIIGPRVLGNATTRLFEGVLAQIAGTGTIDFDYIGRVLLIMLILYLVAAVFAYVMGWIMARVSADIAYRFRKEIAEKINRMPLRYFDRTTIDLLTGQSGLGWEEAWKSRQPIELDGLKLEVIGRDALISNKRATGRTQDLADVERLERNS